MDTSRPRSLLTPPRLAIGVMLLLASVSAVAGARRLYRSYVHGELDDQVRAYWAQAHDGWRLRGPLPDDGSIHGKVLPIRLVDGGAVLAREVYEGLDPALRPASPEEAASVAVIDADEIRYSAGAVPTRARLIVVDARTGAALGGSRFGGGGPPARLTYDEMARLQERFWAPVAAYLNGLARR